MKRLVGQAAKRLENLSVVDPISGCHFFIGCLSGGYGMIAYQGKSRLAHRVSWMVHRGDIPNGIDVLHKCDNPQCVNVSHLSLGTHTDNMRDMQAKGRKAVLKGVKHPCAKLNPEIAFSIRWHDAIGIKPTENAKAHGTYRQMIYGIVANKYWQQECHD